MTVFQDDIHVLTQCLKKTILEIVFQSSVKDIVHRKVSEMVFKNLSETLVLEIMFQSSVR